MKAIRKYPVYAVYIGAFLILLYWLLLKPPGTGRLGYAEDLGGIELTRQIMADNLAEFGRPNFVTHRMMAPTGTNATYCSWALERDWIGGYFWQMDRDFPWLWVYFAISMLVSYFGSGLIMRKMGLSKTAAWSIATLIILVDIPRHFKIYHHYEHLIQHWLYLSFFFDAWIWQRFWRDRKWSWNLELWRGVILLGTFGIGGYYWGPTILEWILVRACMIGFVLFWRLRSGSWNKSLPVIEGTVRKAILPLSVGTLLFGIDLLWFLPLATQALKLGDIQNGLGWTAGFLQPLVPLWLEPITDIFTWWNLPLHHYIIHALRTSKLSWEGTETVVTIGWIYWVPLVFGIVWLRKKRGGAGIGAILPQLILLATFLLYLGTGWPFTFQVFIQSLVPFMKYFRVVSRMGLFLVPLLATMIVLSWPEIARAFAKLRPSKKFRRWVWCFGIGSVLEVSLLFSHTVTRMPPMDQAAVDLFAAIKASPGTTVLDMPFCVAGGNGVCTTAECPNYPYSATAAVMTGWHDKKVFGFYEARMVPDQCELYNHEPFLGFFDAWKWQRCLNESEWKNFCSYLDASPEISAILVYPGIWRALENPACRAQFDQHFGPAKGQAELLISFEGKSTEVLWYDSKCRKPEIVNK